MSNSCNRWEETLACWGIQSGTITTFSTFSAAEMLWSRLIKSIKRQQSERVDFEGLHWSTQCENSAWVQSSQSLCVVNCFYCVECQQRGSSHIHYFCVFHKQIHYSSTDGWWSAGTRKSNLLLREYEQSLNMMKKMNTAIQKHGPMIWQLLITIIHICLKPGLEN